ncbi:MAG: ABC transporter ATP-binding protein [Candidatus Thermoplasmatota archaeon]|nr:ABC transporter ATP-binding protein [Candidatus Thermoplasmatota archaeon]
MLSVNPSIPYIGLGTPKLQEALELSEGMDSENPIVSLEDVVIGYESESPLVSIPNLEIFPGEIVAIAGPSGIGKSTLLGTIAGLIPPISGSIKVCGAKIPSKPLRGSLGYIPQKLGLVRHASVSHNVMLGARAGSSNRKDRKERVTNAIEKMGLKEKSREPIRRLSGGQQRRVATARTLAQRPKLILADEFLSELDEETLTMVLESVKTYVKESESALIVVEHDISRAKSMANRLLVIDDGRVNPFITEPKAMVVDS